VPNEFAEYQNVEEGTSVRKLLVLVGAVIVSLALWAPAAAGQRAPVTIKTTGAIGSDGHQAGTFEATGAFTDTGAFFFREDVHKLFHFSANGADNFGIAHSIEFFTSPAGTFELLNTVKFTFTGDVANVTGNWTVSGGTGAYTRLRGNGKIVGTIGGNPEQFIFTFTGDVDLT
jgi:hypothetical protein